MQDRFPRTAAEFLQHGRLVVSTCESCLHSRTMTGDVIAAAFGEDFDLYTGFAELTAQIYCEACGASRPRITFKNPNERHFGPYSMEESITAHLERGAFAQARDGEEPKRRYRGNYRKFGRR